MNISLAPDQGNLALGMPSNADAAAGRAAAGASGATMRLGYLTSRYPAVSHTFILREIHQLREAGFEIHSASVNDPDRACADMTARHGRHITGFIAEPMVKGVSEVILGYRRDPLVGPVVVLGALVVTVECRAVVARQWHFPSDAIAGAAFGVGVVLVVDGLLHVVGPAAVRSLGPRVR